MNTENANDQTQPITAEWLKANTHIHGWLSLFIFALVVGSLSGLGVSIDTYKVSDYLGSALLGMADIVFVAVVAVVAILTIVSLCRRSPSAIFWAKYYTVLVFLSNGLQLCIGGMEAGQDGFGGTRMASGSIFWAIVWFIYLSCSSQVQEVIPKRYRHAGVRTWLGAGLLLLIPVVFVLVGIVDVAVNYHDNVEISQSELSDGELTDGHIVFERLEGWSFGMAKFDNVNVCSFTNDQEFVITLISALDADDTKENFLRTAAAYANGDLEKMVHRTVCNDTSIINGHTCHYQIVRYDREDGASIFWHFAGLYDNESGKVVIVNGYFLHMEIPDVGKLLKSIRFRK